MNAHELSLRVGYAALIALALTLPFELQEPLLEVGPLAISNTEILLGVTLFGALFYWLSSRHSSQGFRSPAVLRNWFLLLALYVVVLFLSALLAPAFQTNAVRAALRSAAGILLIPAIFVLLPSRQAWSHKAWSRKARSRKAWWGVIIALVCGGLVAAAIGLSEVFGSYDFEWLRPWRATPTVAGPFLRLAGPFDYANQAAMFIEATLPLLVALGIEMARSGRRLLLAILLVVFAFYSQAIILTFSRAALAAVVLSPLMVAGWLVVQRPAANRRSALWWSGASSFVFLLILANFFLSPTFRLRLSSQVDRDWYRATIQVPPSLTMQADETVIIPVSISNTGSLTWYHSGVNQFNLGMRWQLENTDLELSRHPRWPLARTVAPGETITLQVPLRAPIRGGQYRLVWDMVHENVTWFEAKNRTEASSRIIVTGNASLHGRLADSQIPATATSPLQFDAPIPGRRDLWIVALRLFALHPLTGIGLDNFRLTYGRFLNADDLPSGESWNNTIHTNNWYLETLVSLGAVGALPFFAWSALLLVAMFRSLHLVPLGEKLLPDESRPFLTIDSGLQAIAVALLAYFIHGFLDYFMLFNATALLFWMLVGLWVRESALTQPRS
jgi:hypothetical protein